MKAGKSKNISIAVLYSKKDQQYWTEMERHINLILRRHNNVRLWVISDEQLEDRSNFAEVKDELQRADITLMLLSPAFKQDILDDDTRVLLDAYARRQESGRYLLPVVVKEHDWEEESDAGSIDLDNLSVFNGIGEQQTGREETYEEIANLLERYVDEINAKSIACYIPTWVGYLPIISMNGGMVRNNTTQLYRKYRRGLRVIMQDEMTGLLEAWRAGEANLIWATVDRLPYVINQLREYQPKVILQASWSKGADAIVARPHIKSVADLRDKRVLYAYGTPSQTLLRYALEQADISLFDVQHIPQKQVNLDALTNVFINDSTIDAIVVWSPFVEACVHDVEGAHVLVDSSAFPHLIADVLLAPADYIDLNREELTELVTNWCEEVDAIQSSDIHATKAISILTESLLRPLPSMVPVAARAQVAETMTNFFRKAFDKVVLCGKQDNLAAFGLVTSQEEGPDMPTLYNEMLTRLFPEFAPDPEMQWDAIADASLVKGMK